MKIGQNCRKTSYLKQFDDIHRDRQQSSVLKARWLQANNKKLSCRRETAQRFVSLNVLPSHSLKVIRTACLSPYQYCIETMSASPTVSEIFSIKEWCDLETGSMGRSRSLKMAPFDRPYTTLLVRHRQYSSILYRFQVI